VRYCSNGYRVNLFTLVAIMRKHAEGSACGRYTLSWSTCPNGDAWRPRDPWREHQGVSHFLHSLG
jgi:hypothetical protein